MSPQLLRIEATRHPLTGRTVCRVNVNGAYHPITDLTPERDLRIATLPEQPDPAVPGYGYTGRLASVGPVILLAGDQREQIERWQREHDGDPWPIYGMQSRIHQEVLSIQASNGVWVWKLHPAYWPEMGDSPLGEFGWYVGIGP